MNTQSTTDVHSQATNGGSSNVIQNGSLIANVIMFAIVLILLWRGDDRQMNKLFDDMDKHHAAEIADLRRELNDFETRRKDHDNRVQQWEDLSYSHVNKLDAILAAHGLKTPKHLGTPP